MDFTLTVAQIVKEQGKIIGPLAVELARGVDGLELDDLEKTEISFKRDPKLIVHDLIKTYSQFFGKASVEICKTIIQNTCPTLTDEDMHVMTDNTLD
jgi:hypothetical protein